MKKHFMIAELDNTAEILIHLINQNFAIQTKHICQLVKHQLDLKEANTYTEIFDFNDNSEIIFKSDTDFVITSCIQINEIVIQDHPKQCYEHIPIIFYINNTTFN